MNDVTASWRVRRDDVAWRSFKQTELLNEMWPWQSNRATWFWWRVLMRVANMDTITVPKSLRYEWEQIWQLRRLSWLWSLEGCPEYFNGKITQHCGRSLSKIAGSNPALGTVVCFCKCCVLSSKKGLCEGPITLPEESKWVCVWLTATVTLYTCIEQVEEVRVRNEESHRNVYWLVGDVLWCFWTTVWS